MDFCNCIKFFNCIVVVFVECVGVSRVELFYSTRSLGVSGGGFFRRRIKSYP